jgi:hypothetical protein
MDFHFKSERRLNYLPRYDPISLSLFMPITDRFRRSSINVLGRAKRRTLRMTITIGECLYRPAILGLLVQGTREGKDFRENNEHNSCVCVGIELTCEALEGSIEIDSEAIESSEKS